MDAETKMKVAVTPQQAKFTEERRTALSLYKELAVGEVSWGAFLYYELCMFALSNLAGLPGFALRALLYPAMFKSCGRRPAFGRSLLIRNPYSISLGNKVLIDDSAVLDVRGHSGSIALGDLVSIGRFTTIVAKQGLVNLEQGVNIGSYCRIATQSRVHIGESTLVAAYSYIGPGNHQRGDDDTPLIEREMEIKGGVSIGKHVWIGAKCTILDGVTIGDRAVIGAHSLVLEDVAEGAVVAGTPAKRIR